MKLFSAIMAIYIMGLLLVPCANTHAENIEKSTNVEIIDLHEVHLDSCSPFCFCDCCQRVSQPAAYNYISYFTTLIDITIPFIKASEISVPAILWRPPKI